MIESKFIFITSGLKAALIFTFVWSNLAEAQVVTSKTVTTSALYGDWTVRCEQEGDQPNSCVMTHKVLAQPSNKEVAQANFAKSAGGTQMTLVVPLNVYLPSGITLEVIDHQSKNFDFTFCSQAGCFVNEILDDSFLELLRKKESAVLSVYSSADQKLDVPFSLTGFLDAYRTL